MCFLHSSGLKQNNPCYKDITIDFNSLARAAREPRSQPVQYLFKSCVDHLNNTSDARRALRSAMICCVGERDFSAQETSQCPRNLTYAQSPRGQG